MAKGNYHTRTVALLVTNSNRSEVLLVRKPNSFGPVEYGLVGLPPGGPTSCFVNMKAMLATTVLDDALRASLWHRTDQTPLMTVNTNPTGKAALGAPALFDVHLAVANDHTEWNAWCFAALRGGFASDAFWLPRAALERFVLSSREGHTCYERRKPDAVSSKAIASLLDAGKAIDAASSHLAGPRDYVTMKGTTIVVHAFDDEQAARLTKRAKGLLEWLPKGLTVEVRGPERSLP